MSNYLAMTSSNYLAFNMIKNEEKYDIDMISMFLKFDNDL